VSSEVASLQYCTHILTNPIYAGAYAFGRTTSKVSVEQGRKRVRRACIGRWAKWDVLIKDHHEAYTPGRQFERNQRVIANNATGKGSATRQGSGSARRAVAARTPALWSLRPQTAMCPTAASSAATAATALAPNHGTARCISISGLSIDAAVGAEVLRILKPLA